MGSNGEAATEGRPDWLTQGGAAEVARRGRRAGDDVRADGWEGAREGDRVSERLSLRRPATPATMSGAGLSRIPHDVPDPDVDADGSVFLGASPGYRKLAAPPYLPRRNLCPP